MPLEAEDTLGQRGAEALTTLEVVGRMLGGKSMVFWLMLAKSEGRLPRWPKSRKRRRQAEPGGGCSSTLSMSCPPLARRWTPRPTLKSVVILAFPDKDT